MRRFQRLSWQAAALAIMVNFTISANLLTSWGSRYMIDGGTVLEKIHPGSYISIVAGLFALVGHHRGASADSLPASITYPLVTYISGILLCSVSTLLFSGPGNLVVCLDTFLPAGCLALAMASAPVSSNSLIRPLIQVLLASNAVLAAMEFVVHSHLVTNVIRTETLDSEFRSTGLYDHPLTGSAITMIGLWLRPDPDVRPFLCFGYITVLLIALLAFGERTPIALAAIGAGASLCLSLWRQALTRRFDLQSIGGLAFLLLLASGAGFAAICSSMSFRFAEHLYWDGSAQVRLAEFRILDSLTPMEIFFGCPRIDLLALIERLRLSYSVGVIENFWLMMFVTLGAFSFSIFLVAFSYFIHCLWRNTSSRGRTMIVLFLAAASSSNSLGHKSPLLSLFVACVMAAKPMRMPIAQRVSLLVTA